MIIANPPTDPQPKPHKPSILPFLIILVLWLAPLGLAGGFFLVTILAIIGIVSIFFLPIVWLLRQTPEKHHELITKATAGLTFLILLIALIIWAQPEHPEESGAADATGAMLIIGLPVLYILRPLFIELLKKLYELSFEYFKQPEKRYIPENLFENKIIQTILRLLTNIHIYLPLLLVGFILLQILKAVFPRI